MKTLDENKIYWIDGIGKLAEDSLIIGYKGVGQATVPRNLIVKLNYSISAKELLRQCVIESQYVDFEPVNESITKE